MNNYSVKTIDLCKSFDDVVALDSVCMTLKPGSIYGLVGPNGAGKTTLLKHLNGIYRPDSGMVLVVQEPVYENKLIKQRIASVLSDFYFPAGATLKSMLRLYKATHPLFDEAYFWKLQKHFQLPTNKVLKKFSKGMQKQAMIWLTLATQPKLLLLDEPMDGLDPFMRKTIWGLIMDHVAQNNCSVVVSSHNLRELEGICDHIGIMQQGKLICEHDLLSQQNTLSKVQIALPDNQTLPKLPFEVVHASAEGKLHTLIIRGDAEVIREHLEECNPLLLEIIPLSLEELFLYELKGVDNNVTKELL